MLDWLVTIYHLALTEYLDLQIQNLKNILKSALATSYCY